VSRILIDMSGPEFQATLFAPEKIEAMRVFSCLRKISELTWQELYFDRGLRWEAIESRFTTKNQRLYSFRISQKSRAVALRDGGVLRLLRICPDHDSAYQ